MVKVDTRVIMVGMMESPLDDVEQSLISIKHRLQHHQTFRLLLGVYKNVEGIWPRYHSRHQSLGSTQGSGKLCVEEHAP